MEIEEPESHENKEEHTVIDVLDTILEEIGNEDFREAVDSYRTAIEEELFRYFERYGYEPEEPFNSRLYSASAVIQKLVDPDYILPHEMDSSHSLPVVSYWGKHGSIPSDLGIELTVSGNPAKQLGEYADALDGMLGIIAQQVEQLSPLTGKGREAFDELLPKYRELLRDAGIPLDTQSEVIMRALLSTQIREFLGEEENNPE